MFPCTVRRSTSWCADDAMPYFVIFVFLLVIGLVASCFMM